MSHSPNSADEMVEAAVRKRQSYFQGPSQESPDVARPTAVFYQRGFPETFLSDGPFVHLLQAEQLIYSAMRKCDRSLSWGPLAFYLRGQGSLRSRSLASTNAILTEIRQCARGLEQWFAAGENMGTARRRWRAFCDFDSLAEAEVSLGTAFQTNERYSKLGLPGRLWLREARLLKADWETFRQSVFVLRDLAKNFEVNRAELGGQLGVPLPSLPLVRQALLSTVLAQLGLVEAGLRSCSEARAAWAGFVGSIARLNRQLLEAKQLLVREWTSDLRALRPVFSTAAAEGSTKIAELLRKMQDLEDRAESISNEVKSQDQLRAKSAQLGRLEEGLRPPQ